ncbi:hypothetical protein [Diaphorobacter caeni]|uniref:hypothetical protein n=1 Tax=Diaphorobacter caeni TaxID=2784387 RepID=UPI0018904194|nr:hypothetical protein [Diaphorobacter caeni]MBF5004880.1 hypothetical protein [Diaphorobacter caeni]
MKIRHCIHTLLLLATAWLLSGCGDQKAAFEKMLPKEEVEIAQQVLTEARAGNAAAIKARMDLEFVGPSFDADMARMLTLFPAGEPSSIKPVGLFSNTINGNVTTYNITFEQRYPDSWLLAAVQLRKKDGETRVIGMRVQPTNQSLEEQGRFTLEGKSAVHWAVLVLAVLIPLFILVTLVRCWRTPIARRKWLWMLFILLSVARFSFDWGTGAYHLQPLYAGLLGMGVLKSGPYASWIFTLAFPLGAVVFWLRRPALLRKAREAAASSAPPAAPVEPPATP